MRVVEKKCPNCGASIEINEDTKIYKCKYCHTTLEKDKNEEFIEETRETALKFAKGVFAYVGIMQIFALVVFLIIFIIAIVMFITAFSRM